jgi:hypothetical protein
MPILFVPRLCWIQAALFSASPVSAYPEMSEAIKPISMEILYVACLAYFYTLLR